MDFTKYSDLLARATGALALALALAGSLAGCGSGHRSSSPGTPSGVVTAASGFAGAALPSAMPAPDFTLRDQSGRAVSPHRFHGEVALLAFVSATCGATCVLFGDQIRGALDELARPIPVLLVSLDPAADSAARTTAFLARTALSARARYLSGPPQQLAEVWRAYGLHPIPGAHGRRERAPRVLLLDRSGRVRVIFELEQLTPEGLAHDVRKLLAG